LCVVAAGGCCWVNHGLEGGLQLKGAGLAPLPGGFV
jgi:hypothetical protein